MSAGTGMSVTPGEEAPGAVRKWLRRAGALLSVLVIAGAGVVLVRELAGLEPAEVVTAFAALSPPRILLALSCSAAIFVLLAVHETLAVRWLLRLRVAPIVPCVSAFTANPIGHSVGLPALSGGALRYRLYSARGVGAGKVAAIVLLCLLPTLLGMMLLADLLLAFASDGLAERLPGSTSLLLTLGVVGLVKDVAYLVCSAFLRRPLPLFGLRFVVPPLPFTLMQLAVGCGQQLLAATILYLLLPAATEVDPLRFMGAYLASVVLGIVSHVPAGLGVLESSLLVMLPEIPRAELLAGVLAYRVVLELLPLIVALLLFAVWSAREKRHRSG